MKIIGITGGIGAGKSQILEYLSWKYGATVCQADKVARKLQKKGTACYEEIVRHFGEGILDRNGELDREKLAGLVFGDDEELDALNRIVHPAVKKEIKEKIRREERRYTNLFVLEAALLVEDHYEEICDEVWFVSVDDPIRKKRLASARGYDSKKIEDIFAAQLSKDVFLRHCDRVIDNNGIFEETKIQLDEIIRNMQNRGELHI